jgi:hypothetical protein
MKLSKVIAIPAIALTAGLSLAACGSAKAPAAAPAATHTVTAPATAPKPTTPAPTTPAPAPAPAKTVYVQAPAAPAPAAPAAPVLTDCGNYLYVNADTSCPFAQNVEADYTGLGADYASSPVTGQDYTMNCVAGYGNLNGGDSVVCTGGDNALVEWGAN